MADPCSSLLTVGRVPVMNFVQTSSSDLDPGLSQTSTCNSFCYSPQHRLSSVSAPQLPTQWITSRNTWGLPMQVCLCFCVWWVCMCVCLCMWWVCMCVCLCMWWVCMCVRSAYIFRYRYVCVCVVCRGITLTVR